MGILSRDVSNKRKATIVGGWNFLGETKGPEEGRSLDESREAMMVKIWSGGEGIQSSDMRKAIWGCLGASSESWLLILDYVSWICILFCSYCTSVYILKKFEIVQFMRCTLSATLDNSERCGHCGHAGTHPKHGSFGFVLPPRTSRLRTTMNVENFWLHNVLNPWLEHLVSSRS